VSTDLVQVPAPDSLVVTAQEDINSNSRIHQDMELCHRIRDYDKKSAEMPFIPVLTKKQKQHLKKTNVGKPPYNTRSRGDTFPTNQ